MSGMEGLCVCIYMYICLCEYTFIDVHIHICIYTYTYICVHLLIFVTPKEAETQRRGHSAGWKDGPQSRPASALKNRSILF